MLTYAYAAHTTGPVDLVLLEEGIREARWVGDEEALELLALAAAVRQRARAGATA
ncbi:hypothetical protein BX265_5623 [Streptomyces sp. TLI_235]|nr:hypothetical protein BX265_5623 [Streptomyces sp. TLI_235]